MDAPSPHGPSLAFEDFLPGSVATFEGPTVSREAIVAFARDYDPQPFHLDETAAQATPVGELIASGWHGCALLMRTIADSFLLRSTSMGAPGVEEVRWLRPIRPGDVLAMRRTVLEAKPSRSRPEMGLVRFRFELLRGEDPVLAQTNWIMFGRRDAPSPGGAEAANPPRAEQAPRPAPEPSSAAPGGETSGPSFDELAAGSERDLGAFTFTPEAIVGFARQFDPQPFHLDPEAACRSHFGGLCASGWHTAAIWMKLLIAARQGARAAGRRLPVLGPSPGFRDLQWLKPVYAGDTIRYRAAVIESRPSASRPGWRLVVQRNTAENQHGERVFAFQGAVFASDDGRPFGGTKA